MPDFIFNTYVYAFLTGTLVLFSIASFALAMVTVTNAYRLRNVLISWRGGHIWGLPLFASFFLLTALMLVGLAWYKQADQYYTICSGYVFIALNWFISSYFMSKRYVTDHGIVKNINDPSQTVSWSRIQDFIEHDAEGNPLAEGSPAHSADSIMQQFEQVSPNKDAASSTAPEPENSEAREARIKAVIAARRSPKEYAKSYTFIYMKEAAAARMPSESWQRPAETNAGSKEEAAGQGDAFQCFRLQLYVPGYKVEPFRKILNHKLGRRFQHSFSHIPAHRHTPYRSR